MAVDDKELVHQIKNVFRMKVGDEVVIFNGSTGEVEAEITEVGKKEIIFKLGHPTQNKNEPEIKITLFCSLIKKDNFETACQKATEAGVSKIVPIISSRTVKLSPNLERARKITKEASEQSGRGIVPQIIEPISFDEAILMAQNENQINLFLDPRGGSLKSNKGVERKSFIGIFIGPEGGWSEEELAKADKNNFPVFSLGGLILRAETAAFASVFYILRLLEK